MNEQIRITSGPIENKQLFASFEIPQSQTFATIPNRIITGCYLKNSFQLSIYNTMRLKIKLTVPLV